MVTILNPSFESGYGVNWDWLTYGVGNNRSASNDLVWYTHGSKSAKCLLNSTTSREDGDYIYGAQTINFNCSITFRFDLKLYSSNSNYEFRLYVDNDLKYSKTCDGNTYTDIDVNMLYSGNHVVKWGIYCITSTESTEVLSLDNIRVIEKRYYVKTTGNDSLDGLSWTNAWKTINKAATTVADGVTVHIGFGTYDAEPATNKIAPQNIGSSGIYYLPETETTGGGTGTVSVEQNA
jgi:hypothetical protein